jgi:P27 family predicted phage terminase small subunit
MRGRKPVPTVVKLARGNPGKRPINRDEPCPDALEPACPEELSDTEARTEWERTIVPAAVRGHITASDRVFAIAHCELWAAWRSQLADAARLAPVNASQYCPNPAQIMSNKTLLILAKIDAELGLSPTSRARVHVSPGAVQKTSKGIERYLRAIPGGKQA